MGPGGIMWPKAKCGCEFLKSLLHHVLRLAPEKGPVSCPHAMTKAPINISGGQ